MTIDDLERYFTYLDKLRENGATNMFGGADFLRYAHSELSQKESSIILQLWMGTFDGQSTSLERAQRAIE